MSRLIVYGDIHGCIEEFKELRSKINPKNEDEEFIIGDMFDRGPYSLEVLRYVRENGIKSILGNHEKKYIKYKRYKNSRHKKNQQPPQLDCQQKRLYGKLNRDDFAYLESLPYFIKRGDITLIHAGLTNSIKLEESTDIKDLDKTNWIRFLDNKQNPISLNNEDEDSVFWCEYYDGKQGFIVYGHTVFDEVRDENHTLGIDTGCAYGKKLSAVVFEDINDPTKREIVQVDAKKNYIENSTKEIIEEASFNTIYAFKYDKAKLNSPSFQQKDNLQKKEYLKDFISYVGQIINIYVEKDFKWNYIYIESLDKIIKLKERYFITTEDAICLMVEQFEPIECISVDEYIKLHHIMTVTKKLNKEKLICTQFKKFPQIELSCKIEKIKNTNRNLSDSSFLLIDKKDYLILKYKFIYPDFNITAIKNTLKELEIKGSCIEKYTAIFKSEFDEKVNKTTLSEYLKKRTQNISLQSNDISDEVNLSSYHLIDNINENVEEFFLEALFQYRRKIDNHSDKTLCIVPSKTKLSSDITTYSSGMVVAHIGKNIFRKNIRKNMLDNYNKHHFFTYLIVLIQFSTVINLISEAIFEQYDNKERLKMKNIKQRSLNFLSRINFETISYSSTVNEFYKFYRKQLDIKGLKDEILSIIDKIGFELEERHKKRINKWLYFLTGITTLGSMIDLIQLWNWFQQKFFNG